MRSPPPPPPPVHRRTRDDASPRVCVRETVEHMRRCFDTESPGRANRLLVMWAI